MTEFGFDPARAHGLGHRRRRSGPCATARPTVFMALGGNFVAATPDTAVIEKAMGKLALTVQCRHQAEPFGTLFQRPAARCRCPALGRTERDVRGGKPRNSAWSPSRIR